jgi:hypothetical protein
VNREPKAYGKAQGHSNEVTGTDETQAGIFTDELLDALGAWQRGWKADDDLKKPITEKLVREAGKLPARFRTAPEVCYRKRFLFKKDMERASTTEWQAGARTAPTPWISRAWSSPSPSAAYFEHKPHPDEVIVNFPALWADQGFREAAEDYRRRRGREAEALFNFADRQAEIVLHARLHAHEAKAMVAETPAFDAACDEAGVGEDARDDTFRTLTEGGMYFGVPRWSSEEGAQRALTNTRRKFLERNAGLIEFAVRSMSVTMR